MAEGRRLNRVGDTLLLLEHPHTYTLGRRGNPENILLPPEELQRRGIAVHRVDRGGDVTYHGPGQLVGYPILRLPPDRLDYVGYIRLLEEALLRTVRRLGVTARLIDGYSGVWVGDDKVCAVGVKVDSHGITSHGFALNVNVDRSYFEHIIPCGIPDKGVTSLDILLGRRVSKGLVQRISVEELAATFGLPLAPRAMSRARLQRLPI